MQPIVFSLTRILRFYQFAVSPLLGCRCRFEPSCSHYAQTALERHGILRGGALSIRRLLRCHPWGGEGFDPVPPFTGGAKRRLAPLRRAACVAPSGEAAERKLIGNL